MTSDRKPIPILDHPVREESVFTAESLVEDVRRLRGLGSEPVPRICVLEFDGDLTDWLVEQGLTRECPAWACFHTRMFLIDLNGIECGIIPRTIGGPYAVLIAEQLRASGAELIVGLTSAGRVAPDLPLPSLVVATSAIRDEGTSYHYLPAAGTVDCPTRTENLERALIDAGFTVRSGCVWTTDAPYRETRSQLSQWAEAGALAVEMQAASLFAFAQARTVNAILIARVSNAVDHDGPQFDTGTHQEGVAILRQIASAFPPP